MQSIKGNNSKNKLPNIFYGRDDLKSLLNVSSLGKPIILEVHGPPKNENAKILTKKLLYKENFKHLVVTSHVLRNEYLRLFPMLKKKKIIVAHNAADFPKEMKSRDNEFKLLGRNTSPKVGYIGNLYPGKGMEIITKIAKYFPNIDFHIIGGTLKDIKRCKASTNLKNIIFYGFVPQNKLTNYYNYFDIILAPHQYKVTTFAGRTESSKWLCPLKIFEYMANSKAIIASDLPVLREFLSNEVNCLLCPPQNLEAWINAVQKLANNDELRVELANNAYNDFLSKFTWKKRAEKVIENLS